MNINLAHKIITTALENDNSNRLFTSINKTIFVETDKNELRIQALKLRLILDSLEENEYIKWKALAIDSNGKSYTLNPDDETYKTTFAKTNSQGRFCDLSGYEVFVRLTPKGTDYAIDTKRKNTQHLVIKISVIVAIISAAVASGSLYKTLITQREFDSKLQTMQTNLKSMQDSMQATTNRLNQMIESNVLDSLPDVKK